MSKVRGLFRVAAIVAAGGVLHAPVGAQPPGEDAASTAQSVDEVVVRGRRMSEIKDDLRIHVGAFVQQVAAPPEGRGYARWYRRVCVSVSNLESSTAQYLVDRISRLALQVGLEPGEPGCRPDVVVIFTTNGRETASYIVDNEPTLLRPFGDGDVQRGMKALREFAESDKPVRWWHVSWPVDARTGTPATRVPGDAANPGLESVRSVSVAGPSRIHSGIRDELQSVLIIVDGPKLQGRGTTWQQLGDYLALVSLAQIKFETNPAAYDTILNLFDNPGAYSGLTDWDLSYVHSLYSYNQEREPNFQRNELVSRMVTREIFGDE